jgi:hypothetical protein
MAPERFKKSKHGRFAFKAATSRLDSKKILDDMRGDTGAGFYATLGTVKHACVNQSSEVGRKRHRTYMNFWRGKRSIDDA